MGNLRSRIAFLLVPLLIFIFAPASHVYIRTVEGFVQKVSDGDKVTLITRDGTKLRVRLYGIDAPEVRHEKKQGQFYGEEAKRALAGKVLRKEVALMIQDTDRYKRRQRFYHFTYPMIPVFTCTSRKHSLPVSTLKEADFSAIW